MKQLLLSRMILARNTEEVCRAVNGGEADNIKPEDIISVSKGEPSLDGYYWYTIWYRIP